MALMGHSQGSARTTNDLYTHIEFPVMRNAIRELEAWCAEQVAKLNKKEQKTNEQTKEQPTQITGPDDATGIGSSNAPRNTTPIS